jgi:hypothetical protein
VIFRSFAGKLDDKCLALKPLYIRQRFAQQIEAQLITDFVGVSHFSLGRGLTRIFADQIKKI